MHVFNSATELAEPDGTKRGVKTTSACTYISPERLEATPPASPTPRNSANKLWTKCTRREAYNQHMRIWASHHDSSAYFQGSISLHPQGTFPTEDVELGMSVNCILTDASARGKSKSIIVRLFKSQRYDAHDSRQKVRGKREAQVAPYLLVIRSGSGWITARQYLDQLHFAQHTDIGKEREADPQQLSISTRSRHLRAPASAKDIIKISPLFRPFLRLPQELQDEILYKAAGYTRDICLSHTDCAGRSSLVSEPPITISKLFRISKRANEDLVPHIFCSTNFHFGMTGFTKFLWQLGPTNRSELRHITFHFGKASLLHCMRWMAPDTVWELFKPPVASSPPTLTYFWRCQLRDLMKELTLLTLTIDITDVPPADVPMLVRIINTAVDSVERIRVIDNKFRSGSCAENGAQDLSARFPDMQHSTWRELSLQYHKDYKCHRWHMQNILVMRNVDYNYVPILETWMNQEKSFFDS
ncbi:hypothetical protein C7974DRAFT_315878 [Boeremia exigua]|uniref:uncharacterized protein n=1 Tax=Boeremia exigua TaxID=749465 RepID=UPI001E8DF17E|nr:uncharacterized protein C7974DRAFT_315878 [Boeremia exigua]KAH6620225.1 hypothetical protein C7974DRAFT_315878 [Boeremia exigua]